MLAYVMLIYASFCQDHESHSGLPLRLYDTVLKHTRYRTESSFFLYIVYQKLILKNELIKPDKYFSPNPMRRLSPVSRTFVTFLDT